MQHKQKSRMIVLKAFKKMWNDWWNTEPKHWESWSPFGQKNAEAAITSSQRGHITVPCATSASSGWTTIVVSKYFLIDQSISFSLDQQLRWPRKLEILLAFSPLSDGRRHLVWDFNREHLEPLHLRKYKLFKTKSKFHLTDITVNLNNSDKIILWIITVLCSSGKG